MEDFIYIILVIAWLVVSIMKRRTKAEAPGKPGPASRPKPAPPAREFDLEEALREMFGGTPAPQPKPAPAPVPQKDTFEVTFEDPEPEYQSMAEELTSYQEPEYHSFGSSSAVSEEYQFSTEVRDQTIDELIRANNAEEARQQAADEMRERMGDGAPALEFDAREAVIYSEILNRKYS